MIAVPGTTVETSPVAEPMVATSGVPLLQVPPDVEHVSVDVVPIQTLALPVIEAAIGLTLTVTVATLEHPLALVPVTV
jgi:hypothetical protein